jgi:hypothetical protein
MTNQVHQVERTLYFQGVLEAVLVPKGDFEDRCVVANSCKRIQDIHKREFVIRHCCSNNDPFFWNAVGARICWITTPFAIILQIIMDYMNCSRI